MDVSTPEGRAAYEVLLRKQDWATLRDQLVRFATFRCKSKQMAADLAHEAMRYVFDPLKSPWDPDAQPVLARHLMGIVNSLLINERTSARARRDVPLYRDAEDEEPRPIRDPNAFSEAQVVENDLFARRMALLRARLGEGSLALRVLELVQAGTDTPEPMRKALGCSLNEVLAARRLVQRAAEQVARDVPDDDEPPSRDETDDEAEEVA